MQIYTLLYYMIGLEALEIFAAVGACVLVAALVVKWIKGMK